jgi:outer membrane protein TolC
MMVNRKWWLAGSLLLMQQLAAQTEVLKPETVLDLVRRNHPIAKQAVLSVKMADAEKLAARGAFDPSLDMEAARKTFDGKNYYFYTNPELRIPTAAAVTVKAGTENNGGGQLSPETTTGKSSYLGVELPLGNGLLMDKRRAALKQAALMQQQSEQERRSALNDLLLAAYSSYCEWAGAFRLFRIYGQVMQNAEDRLRLVKLGWKNGDRSAMDTMESYVQLEQYKLLQQEAATRTRNAALGLSGFLWGENDSLFWIPPTAVPDTMLLQQQPVFTPADELVASALLLHPDIKSAALKISSQQVEQKLKFQNLLPYVNLKAQVLSKEYSFVKSWDAAYFQNNYKWGIGVNMPLFLRQARGEYKKTTLKLESTRLDLALKTTQTEIKIRSMYNDNLQLLNQVQGIDRIQQSYYKLLRNEELRFFQGESSLFLINSREMKWLETIQKQTELQVKLTTGVYKLNWAAGLLQ